MDGARPTRLRRIEAKGLGYPMLLRVAGTSDGP